MKTRVVPSLKIADLSLIHKAEKKILSRICFLGYSLKGLHNGLKGKKRMQGPLLLEPRQLMFCMFIHGAAVITECLLHGQHSL